MADPVTLLLCGDIMLGRGVDQVLAHPGDPALAEEYLHDARQYVDLVDQATGDRVPRPVDDTWPWGEALEEVRRSRPAVLVLNLETTLTRSSEFAPGKRVHYRASPDNVGALLVAEPDVCVLANNHVLDLGRPGLDETLRTLDSAGVRTVGAGQDLARASAPARVGGDDGPPVVVLAYTHGSSGVPTGWAAGPDRSGVALLPDLSARTTAEVAARVAGAREAGAVVLLSLHWGSNWGYDVPHEQARFARRMVEAGVDVVHGHSSHHPRPIEVRDGRAVLYGCGDFVNDYEGIRGHEQFRDDLRVLYRLTLDSRGALVAAELVPFRSRRLRLERATSADTRWLATVLDRESRAYGVRVHRTPEDHLVLDWSR